MDKRLMWVCALTVIGASIGFFPEPAKEVTPAEYEDGSLACYFSGGVESYYEEDDKVSFYCYDGSVKWITRVQ